MSVFSYSYEQMNRELQSLKQAYPGKIVSGVPAFSADGRKIIEVMLGRTDAEHHVLLQAGMHGREYLNSAVVMRQIRDYLRLAECGRYGGYTLRELYGNVCFHVMPMVNPDGVTISREGAEGIRNVDLRRQVMNCSGIKNDSTGKLYSKWEEKNFFRRWKSNARGVDINRNFDAGWKEYQGPSGPSSEGFKGVFPGSEAETQAVLNIARKWRIACCIAYHSSGNMIYWDYGSEGAVFEADRRLAKAVGKITGYPLQSTVEDCADAAGCSDYFVKKCGIPAVTIETGDSKCPLPDKEFEPIYRRNRDLWPEIARLFAEKILP